MNKVLSILLFSLILISCNKKKNSQQSYTPDCAGATPTFSASVSPLIISSCASSGCHSSGSTKGCGPLTNYSQIENSASAVRSSIISGSMPKGSSLTTEQKNRIICWIEAGAINN